MEPASFLIEHADVIATCTGPAPRPACGTTTCETKSGYGLTVDSELRQLQISRSCIREGNTCLSSTSRLRIETKA